MWSSRDAITLDPTPKTSSSLSTSSTHTVKHSWVPSNTLQAMTWLMRDSLVRHFRSKDIREIIQFSFQRTVVFVLLHMKMQIYFNSGFKEKGFTSMITQTYRNVSKTSGTPSYTQNKTRIHPLSFFLKWSVTRSIWHLTAWAEATLQDCIFHTLIA